MSIYDKMYREPEIFEGRPPKDQELSNRMYGEPEIFERRGLAGYFPSKKNTTATGYDVSRGPSVKEGKDKKDKRDKFGNIIGKVPFVPTEPPPTAYSGGFLNVINPDATGVAMYTNDPRKQYHLQGMYDEYLSLFDTLKNRDRYRHILTDEGIEKRRQEEARFKELYNMFGVIGTGGAYTPMEIESDGSTIRSPENFQQLMANDVYSKYAIDQPAPTPSAPSEPAGVIEETPYPAPPYQLPYGLDTGTVAPVMPAAAPTTTAAPVMPAAPTTGAVAPTAGPSAPPGFLPPPAGSINTQAFVNYYNPTTGETWAAPTGGWTAPEGWEEGTVDTGTVPPTTGPVAPVMPAPPERGGIPSVVDSTTDMEKLLQLQRTFRNYLAMPPEEEVITPADPVTTATIPTNNVGGSGLLGAAYAPGSGFNYIPSYIPNQYTDRGPRQTFNPFFDTNSYAGVTSLVPSDARQNVFLGNDPTNIQGRMYPLF
jgi:hypothetical protein